MNRFFIKLLLFFNVFTIMQSHKQLFATAAAASMPIITRLTKNALSPDLVAQAQSAKMSILTPTSSQIPLLYQSYPQGSMLFPNNSDIAGSFDTMIASIKKNPDLIVFFRKIYLTSLNQLYNYMIEIYTNLNLTAPGCSQTTATPTADVSAYLVDDATYATNKKKLIINHFMNLIQAQFGSAVVSYVPSADPDTAVSLGELFLNNDHSIDLTPFATKQTNATTIASQDIYFKFLQQYLTFFKIYTNYLTQADATTGINQYYTIAVYINSLLQPSATSTTPLAMNPSMFFYDVESMRAILSIPAIANSIPAQSKSIPWAPIMVDAATKNTVSNGHSVAFFTDSAGKNTTDQSRAQHLYLLIETGSALFEQELLAQPAWLNAQDSTLKILRGCLGDLSALVGLGILDAQTETIINKGLTGKSST